MQISRIIQFRNRSLTFLLGTLSIALLFLATFKSFGQDHAAAQTDTVSLMQTTNAEALQTEVSADHNEQKGFNIQDMIFHHISDDHEWHFAHGLVLPLPIILYTKDRGVEVFLSSKFDHHTHQYDRYTLTHGHISYEENGVEVHPIDLSITKNVASLMLSAIVLLLVFTSIAKSYKKGLSPKGLASWLEPIVLYIKDEVIKPNIPHGHERFTPYLLTVFFFIWINNLLGLIPGGANLTGNITITLFLAVLTFIITTVNANKYYWGHIFMPPGVPKPLLLILVPIEIVGIFVKPFSLMIRLFANITAGHIIILSFIGLIFIFESFAVGVASVAFGVFMSTLELLVAFLQAYIFTLLSSMYFGAAVEEHH